MKMIRRIFAFVLPALIFISCYKDNKEDMYGLGIGNDCDTTDVTFSATISPVLQSKCATSGCHDAGTQSSGVNLSAYSGAKSIAVNGSLMQVINHASGYPAMPQGGAKLDDCTIAKIQKWVNDGAPNN